MATNKLYINTRLETLGLIMAIEKVGSYSINQYALKENTNPVSNPQQVNFKYQPDVVEISSKKQTQSGSKKGWKIQNICK